MKDQLGMGRVWKQRLEFGWIGGPCISWVTYLVKSDKFEVGKPMLVAGKYFIFKLTDWKWEENHTWYDGNNCSWWYGPFYYSRHGLFNCKGCEVDHEN